MMTIASRQFIATLAIVLIVWCGVFIDGILGMEAIWRRSDTFAHGYFILPIALWLVYRDRQFLQSAQAQPSWLPLPFLFVTCFVWLFAYAADINVLGQLASVTALILLLWALLGNALAWRYKFPLAYLIFAVPMGENLIPALQDITAWITVFLLKVHGIPVFRDGWYIQIPSGMFEVAVACSGIRYLIASMAVGTLYAYLTYSSFKKQLIFIIFAFLLPILANGVRAYLIVIIAHYSDMKYATGADHLVYGWFFFGFVIMLMFWIGGKFADPERQWRLANIQTMKQLTAKPSVTLGLIGAIIGITALLQTRMPVVTPPNTAANALPQYQAANQSNWGVTFDNALSASHVEIDGNTEAFYASYANKQSEGELVSFGNRHYDIDRWTVVERKTVNNEQNAYRYLLLRNIQGNERAVLFWYQIGDWRIANPTLAKLYQAVALLTGRAEYASFVAVSTINTDTASSPQTKAHQLAQHLLAKAELVTKQVTANQLATSGIVADQATGG